MVWKFFEIEVIISWTGTSLIYYLFAYRELNEQKDFVRDSDSTIITLAIYVIAIPNGV